MGRCITSTCFNLVRSNTNKLKYSSVLLHFGVHSTLCSEHTCKYPNTACIQYHFLQNTHITHIAQITLLLLRSNSDLTAQYFKLTMFNGFCEQVCQLFSSINIFYPDVIIKVSFPHIEVPHLNLF